MSTTQTSAATAPRKVGVILGLVVFIVTGFLYLTSGLVVPPIPLFLLWAVWLAGMIWVARLVARWSWWVWMAVPAALGFWFVYLWVGGTFLGWSA